MAFDRQAALDAGYSEQEIDAYLQNQPEAPPPPASATPGEPPAPTTTVNTVEPSLASGAATAAIGAAPYALPAAGALGAAYGGGKLYGAWNASAEAAKALAEAKMASEQGIAQRAAAKGLTPPTTGPVAPAAPAAPMQPAAPTTATGRPYSPQAQQYLQQSAQAAPAAESSVMTKANDIVRKLALDKVLKGAGIAAGGYELGKNLFGTSPEEVATLKAAEQKQIAAGGQPKKRIDWLANLGQ